MAKNCIDILKNSSEQLHKFLEAKAGVYVEKNEASKEAWRKAAKELQNETLNNLNDIYADLGIGDYKKVAASEPPVSSVDALKDEVSTTKALYNLSDESWESLKEVEGFSGIPGIIAERVHRKNNDGTPTYPELVKAVEEAIGKPVSSVEGGEVRGQTKILDKPIKVYHGTNEDNFKSINEKGLVIDSDGRNNLSGDGSYGVSFSEDKNVANKYTQAHGGKNVFEQELPANSKILEVDTKGKGVDDYFNYNELKELREKGFDAIRDISEGQENEIRILNDKAFEPKPEQSQPKGEAAKQPARQKVRVTAAQLEEDAAKNKKALSLSNKLAQKLEQPIDNDKIEDETEETNPIADNTAQGRTATETQTSGEVSGKAPAQKTRTRTKGTRKANRKIKSPVYKKALEVEANTPHDMVMQYFIEGGNIHPSALQEIFGRKGNEKNISKTKQAYIGLLNSNAQTIDELAHQFWEGLPEDSQYTDRDFVNAINEVLGSFNSRTQMAEDINKRYNQTLNEEEKTYEQFLEQQYGQGIPEETVQEAVGIVEEMSADEVNTLLQADADKQAQIIDEAESNQSEGFTNVTNIFDADISKSAQAENRLKTAKSNYDKAARQLKAAEDKITEKQVTQRALPTLLPSEAKQAEMFGVGRDEAKSILDPLRQKVKETKTELDAAQKEFISISDQQLNLFDISNSSLQDGDTKTIGDYVTAAKSVLENLYPNAKLEVFNTNEEYEKAGGEKGTRGFAIMGKEGKHRILLNLEQISKDKSGKTAIHEVIHPIVYDAFGIDSIKLNEAWNDMAIVMKDVPGMEIVFAHVKNYPANKTAPEGITELLTQIVTGNIDIQNVPKEKKNKFVELINKLFEFLGIDFRLKSADDFATLAKKIKQSFDTSNPESLRDVVKQKGIDKFIQEYERLSEKDISRDKIINDFIKEELAAGESIDNIKSALIDNGISEQEAQSFIDVAQPKAAPLTKEEALAKIKEKRKEAVALRKALKDIDVYSVAGLEKEQVEEIFRKQNKLTPQVQQIIDKIYGRLEQTEGTKQNQKLKEASKVAEGKKILDEVFSKIRNGQKVSRTFVRISNSDVADLVPYLKDKFSAYKAISLNQLEEVADSLIDIFGVDVASEFVNYLGINEQPIAMAKIALKLREEGRNEEAANMMANLIQTGTATGQAIKSFDRIKTLIGSVTDPTFRTQFQKAMYERGQAMRKAVEAEFNLQSDVFKEKIADMEKQLHEKTINDNKSFLSRFIDRICGVRKRK